MVEISQKFVAFSEYVNFTVLFIYDLIFRCVDSLPELPELHNWSHFATLWQGKTYNCQPNFEGERCLKKASTVKIQNAKSLSKNGTQFLDTVTQRHANCFTMILIGNF